MNAFTRTSREGRRHDTSDDNRLRTFESLRRPSSKLFRDSSCYSDGEDDDAFVSCDSRVSVRLLSAFDLPEGLFATRKLPWAVISCPSDPDASITVEAARGTSSNPIWETSASFTVRGSTPSRKNGGAPLKPKVVIDLYAASDLKRHLGNAEIPLVDVLRHPGTPVHGSFDLTRSLSFGLKKTEGSVKAILSAR